MDNLTSDQQAMLATWQQHTYAEFVLKDADAALATMTENPYVLLISSGMGRVGRAAVHEFYADHFLPMIPPDRELSSLSQTFGSDRIVEEMVMRLTHSIDMDWLLPDLRLPVEEASSSWPPLSSFNTAKWPMSISIGIRPRCSRRWVSSIIPWWRPELAVRRDF